jgi:hypothetical protein
MGLGAFAWFVTLSLNYALASRACTERLPPVLIAIAVFMLALAVVGGGASWQEWRRARSVPTLGVAHSRRTFVAAALVLANGLFVIAIAALAAVPMVLDDCR